MLAAPQPQEILHTAVHAIREGDDWKSLLDDLPLPVYTTDADGFVTYWNEACVEFAGREPELGRDRWCVTWQLHTVTGERMPHDECPMAEALKTGTEVRGAVAIAMRPDGSRRAFTPYPALVFDERGEVTGAVNLLIDVSQEQAEALSSQAARCKRLSRSTTDARASKILANMAQEYAATAATLKTN